MNMASLRTVLYLEICLNAWIITTAGEVFQLDVMDKISKCFFFKARRSHYRGAEEPHEALEPQVADPCHKKNFVPKAENLRWFSLDFKTILMWTTKASPDYKFSVLYSSEEGDWLECDDCSQVSETECDVTNYFRPFDRTYCADIQTEHVAMDYNHDPEELTHTYSPKFNPYKDSNISAVKFTVETKDERTVIVNITDPLTGIHDYGKQLTIRDVLKNDLKYKISYYKSGSTGKRDIVSDSSVAEVSQLDAGESYCFMVAAFISSRPKSTQHGAWSKQLCNQVHHNVLQELSAGAWAGAVFFVLTIVIIIVTVTVLCCKSRKQTNKAPYTTQLSAPV